MTDLKIVSKKVSPLMRAWRSEAPMYKPINPPKSKFKSSSFTDLNAFEDHNYYFLYFYEVSYYRMRKM